MRITRRGFIHVGAVGTMGLMTSGAHGNTTEATLGAPTPASKHAWLRRRQRIYWYDQYALNEQETAFAHYDPDRIAAELAYVGAEIVAVYAANQFSVAYYPSRVWPMHPNLKGRDYFGEVSSRLKAQGQKVIGYINWLESRHPDWYVVPLEGEPEDEFPLASWARPEEPDWRVQRVPGGRWRFACLNSPRRQQVLDVAREICDTYRPDGFHLDMCFNSGVCVCPYCRPTLEAICGTRDLTHRVIAEHWREFVDWRNECSASLVGEVSAILRERGIFAAHNGQNPLWLSPVYGFDRNLLPHLDIYVSEIFSDLNQAALTMRWHRALGMPSCELLTSTSPYHAHLSVPAASWEVSAACAKANHCDVLGPCGVGAYPDTTSSKRLLENVRHGQALFMEDADLHDTAVPAAKVALVFSWNTRKCFREGRMDWSEELDGWSRVLLEEHIPYDILIAEDVSGLDDLARFDLVILPNIVHVSDAFCSALTDYVRQGGSLLASGETSLGDERGFRRHDFALASLLRITYEGSDEGVFAWDGASEPEPAHGVFQRVKTTANVLARRLSTDPAGSVAGALDPLPLAPSEWPAVVMTNEGKGHAMYVAFGLGRYYAATALTHARDRMVGCIDHLLPARQIRVKAPRCLEVTVYKQEMPERLIFHLANRTPLAHDMPRIHEVPPMAHVELEFRSPFVHPRVSCRGADMTTTVEGHQVTVQIRALSVYAAIVVEP